RQFAHEHPDGLLSLFAYTVDSEFAGVGLNFDTPANSLRRAKANQQYEVKYRNKLFASEIAWKQARYFIANPSRQIEAFNRGSWQYELVQFVALPAWEESYNSSGEESELGNDEESELEGRIMVALWRVVDRLIEAQAFASLQRVAPFRIGFEFHDGDFVV